MNWRDLWQLVQNGEDDNALYSSAPRSSSSFAFPTVDDADADRRLDQFSALIHLTPEPRDLAVQLRTRDRFAGQVEQDHKFS